MKFVCLNVYHGEAYPTSPIYIAVDDISCVAPRKDKGSLIRLKNGENVKIFEAVEVVMKAIKNL